ncbi:dienelactone hydrolase family protein [Variovorax sp. Sphag1AA]|uniref:dienelactone hydrolase family protein n=1 Tax=Variovorax sp. Sphag1AA TaxID=2587027 RepID=UPI0016198701|nr:dienelactone hydrolase family protein [Variovorax sp. Sphag1AA]MBB3181583.1 carboxymethylenebutenolidase [Variovorax sp. Sphag1AA]
MSHPIRITSPEGTFAAYVAEPKNTPAPAPAIVVIHEVFGVNADLRQTCDELAAQGYLAICPDLFWRIEPGIALTDQTEAERIKATALYAAFDLDAGVRDIAAAIETVRKVPQCTGRVGVVGYCLGGLLSYLTTARVGADAAVAYYPGNADKHLEEAAGVNSPLIVHLAEEDEYIGKPAQRQIREAFAYRPTVEVFSYPGCGHAFARHHGIAYDAAAAALANERTRDFLQLHLKRA